jgi:group I intron endonuclease
MIIYLTTNLVNGKQYIGKDRNNNPHYLGGGVLLKEDIKVFGKSKFKKEILEVCSSIEELKQKEVHWLEHFNAANNNNFYNLTNKSGGSDNGPTKTLPYLNRGKSISKSRTGKNYPLASEAQQGLKKTKVSKALIGKSKSEEHKRNLSESKKGIPSKRKGKPDYKQRGKPKPGAGGKGKSKVGAGPKIGRFILNTETGEIFSSVKECMEKFGIHKRKMYIILKDKNNKFQYVKSR